MPSRPARSGPKPRRGPIVWIVLGLVVIIGLLIAASRVWTEILWFDQVDFLTVFSTQWLARAVLFVVGATIMGAAVWGALKLAYRSRPVYAPVGEQLEAMDRYREAFEPLRRLVMVGGPALLGLFAGVAAQGQWQAVLLFLNRAPFGETDPQFGMDLSFFVFTLPALRAGLGFLLAVTVVSGLAAVVMHYLYGGLRFGLAGPGERVTRVARAQLAITAAIACLMVAANYWLDRFSLLMSEGERFDGAGFTAIHANLPAKTILAIVAVFVAALFGVVAVRGNWKLPALGVGLMVLSGIAIGWAYPALVQNFSVNPNAQVKERDYIQRNIDATLDAYGLDNVDVQSYTAKTTAEAGQLREDADSTASIRLLDPTVVPATFRQLQQNKQYYDFPGTLAVDRYTVGDEKRDTVIAVRDLKMQGIAADSQSWVNLHTVYTHGYGVVAAFGNTTDTDGRPAFYEGDIPSQGALGEYEPRIYFGTSSPDYSIVGAPDSTQPWELDYPDDAEPQGQRNNTYSGAGGPSIGNFLNKVLYALKFGSTNILFSDRVTAQSQILYDRDPKVRVAKVAPYLTLDERVYPAVVDERIVWIVDGYTTTDAYPYAEYQTIASGTSTTSTGTVLTSTKTVNYMRNSVKATVDAYTGEVTLYAWDESDPLLKAWSGVYGNTVTPMSEISGQLMSHLRYPESLFKVQRTLLATYHVTDASAFYSAQGFWRTPTDPTKVVDAARGDAAPLQPPYYLTLKMPDQDGATFSLTSTYIPVGTGTNDRNILTGFLAVDSETGNQAGQVAEGYGKLLGGAVGRPIAGHPRRLGVLDGLAGPLQGVVQRVAAAAGRRRRGRRGGGWRRNGGRWRGRVRWRWGGGGAIVTGRHLWVLDDLPRAAGPVDIAGRGSRVALENLVERLVQGVRKPDPLAEGHQDLLQIRELGAGGGLDVDRLDVEQATAHRQGQEVAVDDLGAAIAQQAQRVLDRRVGVEEVLDLAGAGHRGALWQLEEPELAVALGNLSGLIAGLGIDR